MSVKRELVYEYWDCKYCDTKGIRGDHASCATCGHERDKDITFYRKEGAEELVQDQGQAARFRAGADWVCSFCKTLNSATTNACRSCAGARKDAQGNYFDAQREKAASAALRAGVDPAQRDAQLKRTGSKVLRNIGLVLIALIGTCVWLTRTHDVTYEVSAAKWERSIMVQRYGWAERTDWADSLTGDDIQRISTHRELRRTEHREVGTKTESYDDTEQYQTGTRERCHTSYESTGSGASEKVTKCEDEPVYSTRTVSKTRTVPVYEDFPIYEDKVRYRSKAYALLRTDQAEGTDSAPHWPEAPLGKGTDGKSDQEGPRSESYEVWLHKVEARAKGPETLHLKTKEASFTGVYKLGSKPIIKIDNLSSPTLPPGDENIRDKK